MHRTIPLITFIAFLLAGLLAIAMDTSQSHANTIDVSWEVIGPEGGPVTSLTLDPAASATLLTSTYVLSTAQRVYVFSSGNTTTDQRVLEVLSSEGSAQRSVCSPVSTQVHRSI